MLVISRRVSESVVINDNIIVTVTEISGSHVKLGFVAPAEISIRRDDAKRGPRQPVALGPQVLIQPPPSPPEPRVFDKEAKKERPC